MEFRQARDFRMPFGKHIGKTLDEIASTDQGLLDLDHYRGEPWLRDPAKEAIESYLDDPTIAKDLDRLARGGR